MLEDHATLKALVGILDTVNDVVSKISWPMSKDLSILFAHKGFFSSASSLR